MANLTASSTNPVPMVFNIIPAAAPSVQQAQEPIVGSNALDTLAKNLSRKFLLTPHLVSMRHVSFVPVPGGLSVRATKQGLPFLAKVESTFGAVPTDISFGPYLKEIHFPRNRLGELVAYAGLAEDFMNTLEEGAKDVFNNYYIHVARESNDRQIRPTHTLALTLAHLDPEQHNILQHFTEPTAKPEHHNGLRLPLILSDDVGLKIWFPQGTSEDFIEKIKKTFLLNAKTDFLSFQFPGEVAKKHFDTVIQVDRDDVKDFLKRMGLDDAANVRGRADPSHGVDFFLGHLSAIGKYYRYQPVVVSNNPLESISQSLRVLLTQEPGRRVIPLVVLHSVLGLIIRLPKEEGPNSFSARLIDFLGFGSRSAECWLNGIDYAREIVIPRHKISQFLKKTMHLEGIELELFSLLNAQRLDITTQWGKRRLPTNPDIIEIRIATSISRRLYLLMGPKQARELETYSALGTPEEKLPLPRIDFSIEGLTIYFPEILVETPGFWSIFQSKKVSPQVVAFKDHVGGFLGLTVDDCRKSFEGDPKSYIYKIDLPYDEDPRENRILQLLERDLGLRELPPGHAFPNTGRVTCWNELVLSSAGRMGIAYQGHGTVNNEGFKLLPAKVEVPTDLSHYGDVEILDAVSAVLTACEVRQEDIERYLNGFTKILERLSGEGEDGDTVELTDVALRHFIYEISKDSSKASKEAKKEAVVSVALDGSNCLPGSQVRLTDETKKLAESGSSVKNILLSLLEQWKNDVLKTLFSGHPQSVHLFSAAQVAWGEKCGLDVEAGAADDNIGFGENALEDFPNARRDFELICKDKDNILSEITMRVNGRSADLPLFRDGVHDLLVEKGYENDEVELHLERLCPADPETYAIQLTEEAIKLLLIDIGVLNP